MAQKGCVQLIQHLHFLYFISEIEIFDILFSNLKMAFVYKDCVYLSERLLQTLQTNFCDIFGVVGLAKSDKFWRL